MKYETLSSSSTKKGIDPFLADSLVPKALESLLEQGNRTIKQYYKKS